ncbi:MAG: helix-turn-helix transcriptional regulator [Oscillospiraceae bacterium]|nr:helix-turn-helix transcriptional regulator [Oscillospiraceae bacterium]
MSSEIKIKCRLDELMDSRNITSEKLSMASGVTEMKINQYRKGAMESVSMTEIASIMAAMGCRNISELLDVSTQAETMDSTSKGPILHEADWNSPCRDTVDGKHRWYKDIGVSDSLYQEFVCQGCKQRLAVIL